MSPVFDPARDVYWRLKHEPGVGMHFQTSRDGSAWEDRYLTAGAAPLVGTFDIGGGTFTNVAAPGAVRFDDFEISCP